MKISILFFLLIMSFEINARNIGQTEITTDEGIEVFQNEKYYLLKKNVSIISDDFELTADIVRAYFEKDLYDIVKIESEGNATLKSSKGLFAKGEKINFLTKEENIIIIGKKSSLIYNELSMFSDGLVEVNNSTGKFHLEGKKSEIKNDDIEIYGSIIKGKYLNINKINEIEVLSVEDPELANIKTSKINMFALQANYNKNQNIIELFNNVKVLRDNEIITGDYASINTLNQSYKVISKNSEKVKILINKTNE